MANSIFKVHEMINKVGWDVEDIDAKKVISIAEKAGDLMAKGMVQEAGVAFDEIGKMFNKKLVEMGKKSIDFTDMIKMPDDSTLEKMTSSFTSVIANNITDGIVQGIQDGIADIANQIRTLEVKKAELNQKAQKLDKRYKKYEYLSELSSMEYSEFKPLKAEDDLDEQAQRIMGEFVQAEDALNELTRGTKEYNTALIKALEAADKVYRMAQTLNQNKGAVKDKTLLSDFNVLNLSDMTSDIFDKADVDFTKYLRGFDKYYKEQNKSISTKIKNIDAQITALQAKNPEIINESKAKSALKTLQEIEDAYKRLSYKSGKSKGQLKNSEISSAVNYVSGTESLAKLKNAYMKADPEKWEQQYIALVKFVKEYNAYLDMLNTESDSHKRSKIKDQLKSYTELYEQLKPMAETAKDMLEKIINMADGKSLVGAGDNNAISPENVSKTEQVADANQQAAVAAEREEKAKEHILKLTEAIVKTQKSAPNREVGSFYNSQTGEFEKVGVGDEHEYARTWDDYVKASDMYDTDVHSHNTKVAAPSSTGKGNDFQVWLDSFNLMKKHIIKAREEITLFDFSSIDKTQLEEIANQYREAAKKIWDEFKKSAEPDSVVNDKVSVRLKQELEKIMKEYQGVMTSIALPQELIYNPPIKATTKYQYQPPSFTDEYAKASDDVKELVKELATLEQKILGFGSDINNPELLKLEEQSSQILNQLSDDMLAAWNALDNKKRREFFEQLTAEAQATEIAVNSLNDSLKEADKTGVNIGTSVGTGDTSSEDFKALQAKAEGLQTELENANERAHVAEINAEAERDLRITTENALSEEVSATWSAEKRAKEAEAEAERLRQELTNVQTKSTSLSDGTPIEASAEVTQINTLREAIEKVTDAIDLKTQAFFNEQSAVKKVAQSEVHALGEVEKKVTAIRVALNNIKSGTDIGVGLSNVNINVKYPDTNTQQIDYNAIAEAISKINTSTMPITDVGNVLATENTLIAIKAAVESINGKVQQGARSETTSKKPTEDSSKAMVRYEGEPDSKISGNGSQKPTEKINTALTALLKYKTTLQEANQLTGDLEMGINNLGAELSQVSDKEGLAVWNEHFKQFKNASSILQTLVKDYQALGVLQAKADAEIDPTKLAHYLDNIQILQDRIAIKSVDVNVGDDRFEEAYSRAYSIERHSLQQKQELVDANQVEAEIVKRLVKLYEQLGKARAMGNMTEVSRIRQLIKGERSQLTSVDYATDMKFRAARDKGYSAVKTEAENEALKEQEITIKNLTSLYQKLGDFKARAENADEGMATWYGSEIKKIESQIIAETQKLDVVTDALQNSFDDAYYKGRDFAETDILKALYADEDKTAKQADKLKNTDIEKLAKSYEQIGKLQAQFAQTGNLKTEHEINSLEQTIDAETKRLSLTREQIAALESRRNIARAEAEEALAAEQREKNRAHYTKEEEKARKKSFNDEIKYSQREAGLTKGRTVVSRASDTLNSVMQIDGLTPEQINNLEKYKNKIDELNLTISKFPKDRIASEDEKNQLINQRIEVDKYTKEVNELIANYQRLSGDNVSVIGTNILGDGAELDAYKKQLNDAVMAATNGKAQIKGFDATTKTLTYTIKTGKNEFTQYTAELRGLDGALVSVQGSTKKAESFFDSLARKTKEISTYLISSVSLYDVINKVRQGIQYVREIDKALTELKKVTDETEESYERFLDTAAKTGARIGSTISDFTQATAEFARLGYNIDLASQMAEAAIVYTNVGDGIESVSAASESIISTMKGFGMQTSESMEIVDRFNEVGNRFAITSKGIGDALQRSASALAAAGNTIDESIGLITAANTVVQDPESVGTALKTLTLRLRGAKTELEEAGLETENMAETTASLQQKLLALTSGKVDIMIDANTFKSSTQILREMATVWEDMTDIQQAAALELMGGKRQANILSSIISNFDIVEDAITTSMKSSGSAIEENEKYLDSIEGKIQQFTNSLQTMWNNTLDDDVVKDVVDLGTGLIRVVDTLGLIPSILVAIGAAKGLKLLFSGFQNAALPIKTIWQYINELTIGFKGFTLAQMKVNTATATGHLINSQYSMGLIRTNLIQWLTQKSTEALEVAKYQLWLAEKGLTTGIATEADVQAAQAAVQAASIPGDYAKMTTLQLLGLGFKQLMVSVWGATKAIVAFLFTNPVGWMILLTGAIAGGVAIFNYFHETTEELTEELDNFKSELQDIQSELDSLNSELETTQSRMTELLAMDSLSFTEQEELKNLQKQNDELERQIYLLEQRQRRKQKEAENTFDKLMYGVMNNKQSVMGGIAITEQANMNSYITMYKKYMEEEEKARDELVKAEQSGNKKKIKKAEKKLKKAEKKTQQTRQYIDGKIEEWTGAADGIDYDLADDETKEYLDYIYNLEDKFNIISGDSQAKSVAITRIFNKEEFESVSDEIDKLVEKYQTTGDKTVLKQISQQASKAKKDLEAVGLSVDEVVEYFTLGGSGFNSNTIEGITTQYQKGIEALNAFQNKQTITYTNQNNKEEQIAWKDLFDWDKAEKEATAKADVIAKVLQGTDEKTREQFGHLVESVAEGSLDFNQAMKSFGLSGALRGFELVEEQVSALNTNIFKDLDDELSGVIDTFSEFGAALESVANSMEILHTAQTQMNNSGRISVKTALELINSTDQWNEVLKIENGNIQLVDNAEEVLIQTKLDHIRTNLQAALSTVEAQLAQIAATGSAEELATTLEESTNMAVRSLAENMSYLSALVGAFASGNWFGATKAAADAKAATANQLNYKRGTTSNISTAALEERKRNIEAQLGMLEGIDTTQEFKNNYDFDKTPGDKYKDDDSDKNDAFQKAMDYWENRIGAKQARYEQVQNEIDLLEKQGRMASKEHYQAQIDLEKQRLSLLEQQKAEAQRFLGTFKEGSEQWWEASQTLADIEGSIDDVTASIQDLNDAIDQIHWDIFDEAHERFGNLTSQLETVRDLLSADEDSFFNDEGEWTETGVAVLGTYIQELELYKNALKDVNNELANLSMDDFDSEQEYYDKLTELTEKQQDYTKTISDTEQSVVDMYESQIDAIEEWSDKAVEAYQDYIDVVQKALDSERDLYEFKKDIQKQTKDIAALERRIASLSGSTDNSDIAERRKLEAELTEAKEGLNDSYYDHAKDSQSQALDDEASAYEESMTNYIETLREKLDQAKLNMDLFMEQVTTAVTMNAGLVLEQYTGTGIAIDSALTTPWANAAAAMSKYATEALPLMNTWTQPGGTFDVFKTTATSQLTSPWTAATNAANTFTSSMSTVMSGVYNTIKTNVANSVSELGKIKTEIDKINETSVRPPVVNTGGGGGDPTTTFSNPQVVALQKILKQFFGASRLDITGNYDLPTFNAVREMQKILNRTQHDQITVDGKYGKKTKESMQAYLNRMPVGSWFKENNISIPAAMYAKGTLGTTRDEFAIDSEPWLGDELVLVPTPQGNLSYMRRGTGVIPADLTENMMKWGQMNPDAMNIGKVGTNFNMISNAVNKPEFNLSFDALVKADRIDEGTLPEIKKYVTQEINSLVKQMNYAIKGFAR